MNTFFLEELKRACKEIEEAPRIEDADRVIKAYDRIMDIRTIAVKEGLLSIEEYLYKFDSETMEKYLYHLGMLVVDGRNNQDIEEIGLLEYASQNLKSYDALIYLLYYKGVLRVYDTDARPLLKEVLISMFPSFVRNRFEEIEAIRNPEPTEEEKKDALIAQYCDEKCDENNNYGEESPLYHCMKKVMDISDEILGKAMRTEDDHDIALMMKGMKGSVRKRILDSVSKDRAYQIAENMEFMGPVRMLDVEKMAGSFLNQIDSVLEAEDND